MATREQINICEKLIAGGGSCMREWCSICPGSKPTKSSGFCTWCTDDSLFGDPDPYVVIKARGWLDKNADSPQEDDDLPEGITKETAYRTSDGSVYTDRDEAAVHQETCNRERSSKEHYEDFLGYVHDDLRRREQKMLKSQLAAMEYGFINWLANSGLIK